MMLMASPLPKDVKGRAEKKCAKASNIEVLDPGTVWKAEGRTLVLVKDKVTGLTLWLEVPEN
jgi:hypothetical protein